MMQKIKSLLLLTTGSLMAVGNAVLVIPKQNSATKTNATGQSDWVAINFLSEISDGAKILIGTNNGANYLNGELSSGHFQCTAFSDTTPESETAPGVITLVAISGKTNTYKLSTVRDSEETDCFAVATKSGSGGASFADEDDYGWTFTATSTAGLFEVKYQNTAAAGCICSYNNSSFRTYASYYDNQRIKIFIKDSNEPRVALDKESLSKHVKEWSFTITATASHFKEGATLDYDWHIKDGSATDVVNISNIDETLYGEINKAGNTIVEVSVTDGINTAEAECAVTITEQATYPRLTDPAEVYSGMEVILISGLKTEKHYAAGVFEGTNKYLSAVDAAITLEDSAYSVNDNAQLFTIGGKVNEWTLTGATDGVIGINTSKGQLIKGGKGKTNTWTIGFDSSYGGVICTNTANISANQLQFNTTNKIFANYNYSGNQSEVCLFYKEATDPVFKWIQKNMKMGDPDLDHYEGGNTCKSLYPAAKTELLKLSATDIQNFQNDKDSKYTAALARYNAWAIANGDETPFETSGNNSDKSVLFNNSNVNAIVTVTICVAAISSLGVLLIIKKARKNKKNLIK